MLKGVSIIICCYNSASRIEKTLAELSQLDSEGVACEIILVDNASSDDTKVKAATAWEKYRNDEITFNIVDEPIPGVANARTTGINKAKFELSVFCDDDNWLNNNYIIKTIELFDAHPEAAILSGIGIAAFENPNDKPFWFDAFSDGYAVGSKGEQECLLNGVFGAGMAMRTAVIREVINSGKMLLDGRKKNALSAGEDAEICLRVRLAGHQILYSPKLIYRHYLPSKRLTWTYLKRLHAGFAHSYVIVDMYETALKTPAPATLPRFYWLSKALYYLGINFKYWFKQYLVYSKGEGTAEEIRHITWAIIAGSYFKYNFNTVKIYKEILAHKQNLQNI
ncbi:hypothetical protein A0256_10530 [Mucilaginibacter sp. PAMC 26640]|nr:hypothetical protein A0256_10530 [Mucilaginibacter sp. PAMC 26640]